MPEPSIASRSGLFTTAAVPVPLAGVSVDAELSAFCARVAITQRFVNREDKPIEAVYVFPLDEGAAVCGFEAVIDGTLVVGEVKEREEAFRMYDEAMEQGHGAFLLDEERPDVFQASVGNLPAGKEVLLKLTYVTELRVDDGGLRFVIPTTVSPRYAPVEDRRGVGRPDAEALNPPVGWRVPYGLDLNVRLAMGGQISRVESPSHPVSVSLEGAQATVSLSQRDAALDRDFVLSIAAAGLDAPNAWVERSDDGREAVAVAFVPSLPNQLVPSEVIFLVDRSGSMAGTSIAEVRNALQLCLRSMIAGCRFNIIGFGDRHEALFRTSRPYDEKSLAKAAAHVEAMHADFGGTELLPALEHALEDGGSSEGVRQVVVMTDGQVTNTDEVIALARAHAARARVFAFGIGAGASHHLVNGLARAGGGSAEFIYPGERIEPKVVRQFGRLLSPALTDVRLDWDGLAVTQSPSAVPPVFAGGRMLVYGLAKDPAAMLPATVRLSANAPEGPISFDVPIDPARAASGRTVGTLAARARIRELEESPEGLSSKGSRQPHRKSGSAASEIVTLAMQYGLMSRHTSYVAIERRETPVLGDVQLRRVPVALTTGWGDLAVERMTILTTGAGGSVLGGMPTGLVLDRLQRAQMHWGRAASAPPGAGPAAEIDSVGLLRALARRAGKAVRPGPSESSPPSPLHALIRLQHADGSWDLSPDLVDLLGLSRQDVERGCASATGSSGEIRRAWATALAVAWLESRCRDLEDEWRLLVAKAHHWLDATAARPPAGNWIDVAEALIGR